MVSILRVFPNHLVSNAFKIIIGCRYITNIQKFDSIMKSHQEMRQFKNTKINLGKFKNALFDFIIFQIFDNLSYSHTTLLASILVIHFEISQKHFSIFSKRFFKE